uniref:Uncharacterized protein n=1 Tax=Rhizophora mucronata TaxID=61149 RepID=A0A2P2PN00_RHIMU
MVPSYQCPIQEWQNFMKI